MKPSPMNPGLRLLMATAAIGSMPSTGMSKQTLVIRPAHDGGLVPPWRGKLPVLKRPLKKCLLKDCARMTQHNGGYCSAEHCRKDRAK